MSCFSPNLPLTQRPSAPEQDGSRQSPAPDMPRELRPSRASIPKQQRAKFLGSPHILHLLGTPSLWLPDLKTFVANPPQAAPALPQLSPGRSHAVTGWHCAPACAAVRLHPPLLRCPGGTPSWGRGQRLSSPKRTHGRLPAPLRHGGS